MTQEQMERAIDFLLNQQAQFSVELMELIQAQKRTDARLEQIAVHQANLSEIMVALAQGQNTLTEGQKRTESHLTDTNERLNAVILLFERHLSGPRGGAQ